MSLESSSSIDSGAESKRASKSPQSRINQAYDDFRQGLKHDQSGAWGKENKEDQKLRQKSEKDRRGAISKVKNAESAAKQKAMSKVDSNRDLFKGMDARGKIRENVKSNISSAVDSAMNKF